jgi:hypothetical protein
VRRAGPFLGLESAIRPTPFFGLVQLALCFSARIVDETAAKDSVKVSILVYSGQFCALLSELAVADPRFIGPIDINQSKFIGITM